jgi:8-hydroxy-5-deazaflavin:NADPH oxidoreductase
MKIAVVGSGRIGGALARAWIAKQHVVVFGARDPNDADLVQQCSTLGCKAAPISDAVHDAEVVVFAMPFAAIDSVLQVAGDLAGKVLIDCTNAVGPGMKLLIGHTSSAAEELQKKVPLAHVFKSFNAQGAENLQAPVYEGIRASNFFCGDDPKARLVVKSLVEDIGFDAIDAGPLKNARLLEPMMLLWISASQSLGTRDLGFQLLRRPQP